MDFYSTFHDRLKAVTNILLDLFLPRHCVACDRELCPSEKHLCNNCLMTLHPIDWNSTQDNDALRLLWCRHDVEMAGCMFRYDTYDLLHNIFIKIKYHHTPQIGRDLTLAGFGFWMDKGLCEGVDWIVPVPLHWRRRLKRGYNQSEWIARGISQATGIRVRTDIVQRRYYNSTQTHKNRENRHRDTEGIFCLKRECPNLSGLTLLLVDDIITTGSTISDCIRAMKDQFPDVKIRLFTLGITSNGIS